MFFGRGCHSVHRACDRTSPNHPTLSPSGKLPGHYCETHFPHKARIGLTYTNRPDIIDVIFVSNLESKCYLIASLMDSQKKKRETRRIKLNSQSSFKLETNPDYIAISNYQSTLFLLTCTIKHIKNSHRFTSTSVFVKLLGNRRRVFYVTKHFNFKTFNEWYLNWKYFQPLKSCKKFVFTIPRLFQENCPLLF